MFGPYVDPIFEKNVGMSSVPHQEANLGKDTFTDKTTYFEVSTR